MNSKLSKECRMIHIIGGCLYVSNYWGKTYRVRARNARVRAMRTLTKFTTFSTPDNSINMAPIDDALAEIESLEPGENLSYSKIANKYGVWRSTLTRRHKAKTRLRKEQVIIQQKLSV